MSWDLPVLPCAYREAKDQKEQRGAKKAWLDCRATVYTLKLEVTLFSV